MKFFDWIVFSSETLNNGLDSTKQTYFYLTDNSIFFWSSLKSKSHKESHWKHFFLVCLQFLYSQVSYILYVLLDNSWKTPSLKYTRNSKLYYHSIHFMISFDRLNKIFENLISREPHNMCDQTKCYIVHSSNYTSLFSRFIRSLTGWEWVFVCMLILERRVQCAHFIKDRFVRPVITTKFNVNFSFR